MNLPLTKNTAPTLYSVQSGIRDWQNKAMSLAPMSNRIDVIYYIAQSRSGNRDKLEIFVEVLVSDSVVDDYRALGTRYTPVIRVGGYYKSAGVKPESHDVVGVSPPSVDQLKGPRTAHNSVVIGLMPMDVELPVGGRDGPWAVYNQIGGVRAWDTDVVEGYFRGFPEHSVWEKFRSHCSSQTNRF